MQLRVTANACSWNWLWAPDPLAPDLPLTGIIELLHSCLHADWVKTSTYIQKMLKASMISYTWTIDFHFSFSTFWKSYNEIYILYIDNASRKKWFFFCCCFFKVITWSRKDHHAVEDLLIKQKQNKWNPGHIQAETLTELIEKCLSTNQKNLALLMPKECRK